MDKLSFATATVAAALLGAPALADVNANELVTAESAIRKPSVEAGLFYSTMKVERGMVVNDESVFGYEVEVEWYGLFGGVEACYDMTDVNDRPGCYNEIASFLGYGFTYAGFTLSADYVYKACGGEPDTQEVEAELSYKAPWFKPFVELACDTRDSPGALYGVVGLEREWELAECLALVTTGGIGFGDARRNEADYESGKAAFREMHLGAALEYEVCPHVKLVPVIDFYDYFTEAQRKAYDKFNGFACAAGCRIAVDF